MDSRFQSDFFLMNKDQNTLENWRFLSNQLIRFEMLPVFEGILESSGWSLVGVWNHNFFTQIIKLFLNPNFWIYNFLDIDFVWTKFFCATTMFAIFLHISYTKFLSKQILDEKFLRQEWFLHHKDSKFWFLYSQISWI